MSFTPEMYDVGRDGCIRSADVLVPLVYNLVKPRTVIDLGCGEGWFIRKFHDLGCTHTTGVDLGVEEGQRDGVYYVNAPLPLDDVAAQYNLAVCIEVAEHLPEESAGGLVQNLVAFAPVVLFAAAIPGQGGFGHINEQWPTYWADLFYEHGYVASEDLRWQLWDNDDVEPWYRQNTLLYGQPHDLLNLGLTTTRYPKVVAHPIIFNNRPLPDTGWTCSECGQRWISNPTGAMTRGCPNCGVVPA